ncbi:MAG: transcription-repair coupling factor [bacterium]|nr:transcription-repair coupling factor [bacterium]
MEILDKLIDYNEENNIGLYGMTDEFFCYYTANKLKNIKKDILILTSTLFEANKIFSSIKNQTENVLLFPMDDFLTSEAIAISPDLKTTRLDALNVLSQINRKNYIVVCHTDSFLRYLPTKDRYNKSKYKINVGEIYNRNSLIKNLLSNGYNRESIVTNTGELAIRGFIIDIFPINYDNPIRIEFFDDEIESIRYFDTKTQKSIKKVNSVIINPNTEFITDEILENFDKKQKYLPLYTKKYSNINDYLINPQIIIKDYSQLKVAYENELKNILEYKILHDKDYNGNYMFNLNEFDISNASYYNTINNLFNDVKVKKIKNFNVTKSKNFNENIDMINDYLKAEIIKGKTIIICLKETQINSFTKYITNKYILTDQKNIYDNKINIINYTFSEGFIFENYVFLTQKELFNKTNHNKYKSKFKYTSKIKSISNLSIGDYVVHSVNGIGIYNGIKTLKKNNLMKDYIEILYADNDKLYIPVEKIELIGKFTGKEGYSPKINKLGSSEWQKTKLRVKNKVHNIAKDLIELYAKRKMKKGFAFSKDNELQILFENEFEFTETRDQLRAIEQIKKDMELVHPMDRLLCGDVGYGKTEVAFRAMFKAVNDSKQVLYLCPTTILSSQQYKSAIERFRNFPIKIELLNRFTSTNNKNRILENLKKGKIDILFGTHRLLSDDVKPKDLGLLVIDEEQRFGVVHKEKIKQYKENVDVLTLTATPIPRTLQMSLVGMKSLSLIETPPVDRYPIQTYVIEENNMIIKDAIYKELSRGGQVFILYNRVNSIEEKVYQIQNLIPDAKIVYTHGRLDKNEIETRMIDFVNQKYDIMICTTIIETGIDIPNVNTLIIYNADSFGLSQLYQIRGRVGRSNKIAYAYLMYKKDKQLNDIAIKRLNAIKEFTELGSGFSIASRDLSIRGAGDILGTEQAGFIDSVGIDLYIKILNEEVERLKGNNIKEDEIANNLIDVETHIKDEYVEENDLKIEIHKLINSVDSYEKLLLVKQELEDRFGKIDKSMLIYMYEEWFESLAKKLQIIKVDQTSNNIILTISKEESLKIDGEELFINALKISPYFSIKYKNEMIEITLDIRNLEKHYIYYLIDLLKNIKLKC